MKMRRKTKPFTLFQKFTIVLLAAGVFLVGAWAFSTQGGTLANITLSTQSATEEGLLLHWTMDGKDIDGSQDTAEARDRSGNGRHGDAVFPGGAAAITFARDQSASSDQADPATATFGSATTEGNFLIAVCMERSRSTAPAYVLTESDGGTWTDHGGRATLQGDSNARRSFNIWSKVADGTEGTPTTISCDDGTTNSKALQINEFSAGVANATWTFMSSSTADTGTGSDGTAGLNTGSTESVEAGDLFVFASGYWRNQTTGLDNIAWTNSLSDIVNTNIPAAANNQRNISTAWKQASAAGTYDSTVTWTGTGHEASAGIMVFSVEGGGGGGGTTVVPGVIGQALDFDGVDDYVAGGDVDGGVAPRTVAFWMKAATTTASHSLVHLDYSNADYITTDASGNITANGFTADAIYVDGSTASANIPDLDWHHVVVILPSGLAADDFSIASTTSSVGLFGGVLDDIRVYSKVLSADEVSRLYGLGGTTKVNTTVNTQPTLQTGLVGHWTFDGPDIGPNIRDRSGQGNHGNLVHGGSGTTTRPGKIGQALEFDGNTYITAIPKASIPTGDFTYATWVRLDLADNVGIFGSYDSGAAAVEFALYVAEENNIRVVVNGGSPDIENVGPADIGVWY